MFIARWSQFSGNLISEGRIASVTIITSQRAACAVGEMQSKSVSVTTVTEAIDFPSQDALRTMLRGLRSEALDAKPVVSPAVDAMPAERL